LPTQCAYYMVDLYLSSDHRLIKMNTFEPLPWWAA